MKYRINKFYSLSSSYNMKENNNNLFANNLRQYKLKLSLYVTFVTVFLLKAVVPHFFQSTKILHDRTVRYVTDLKYILFWRDPRKQKGNLRKGPQLPLGQTPFINYKCPFINCYVTYDRNALKEDENFDAVVFDVEEVKKMNLDTFNLTRYPEQLYIFRSLESNEKHTICDHDFDHFFNWTWTYKLDSDIPQPFINIHGKNNTVIGPKVNMKWIEMMDTSKKYSNKLKSKSKAVAWVFTKCKLKARHQDFINDLKNELRGYNYSLDLYGPCSQKKCPGGRLYNCYKTVEKQYYFQLVLEDSTAEDYLTDNLASAMTHLSIPIVYGSAQYKNFLPPGSYINAQTFDMRKIGALIDYLIKNREMYEYFFDWKNHYYYTVKPRSDVCELCQKLNEDRRGPKTYDNFRDWWNPEYKDVCQRSHLVKMFNHGT